MLWTAALPPAAAGRRWRARAGFRRPVPACEPPSQAPAEGTRAKALTGFSAGLDGRRQDQGWRLGAPPAAGAERRDVFIVEQLVAVAVVLEGKVALVTGGATGIGESIVRLFREHGAKVCIADIKDDAGQQLRDALGEADVMFVHCDVTVEDDVSRAVDAAAARFGGLDIMVNNAGITGDKVTDIRHVDAAEVRRVFDINVHGVFLGMKHAARVMIPAKKGSIVSLASVASVIGGLGPHGYTASKHAVVGLTKSVAGELGRHGVRVNCVSPYAVPTALSMPHLPQGARADDALKDFLAFVGGEANLKGVDAMPKDVAEAVLYLASDEARYVSALNLVVDGGFTSVNLNLRPFED